MTFNLWTQLQKELDDFNQTKLTLTSPINEGRAKYLTRSGGGYSFSQKNTLSLADLYLNSKFESGEYDSEGQRKVFLNIVSFRADVAIKQVDLDVKNFVFIPEDGANEWAAYFMSKRFSQWAKDSYFGELINATTEDYVKYGTAVLKRVGKKLERVPLKTLRNQQDAKDLKTANYVIEEHEKMTMEEMKAMKGWNTEGLDLEWDETATVYERYGRVPLSFYKEYKGEEYTDNETTDEDDVSVDCLAIITQDGEQKDADGHILFLEKITERPYEEVHWKRQDGRWLGIGEVENLFENQVTKNMLANMRKRALMWSSKHVFQSSDTAEVAKNLIKDVKDGEVLKIMPNGNITQVDMTTHATGEFQNMDDAWDKNSDQKSFTYEVATGESLPSGTPFRLGVVLSNAVNSHFERKRETLGLFFNRVVDNLVIPIFKKDNKEEHVLTLFADEEGVEALKQEVTAMLANEEAKSLLLQGVVPDLDEVKAKVQAEIGKRKSLYMIIPENFYDTIKAKTTLVITGEQVDLPKKLETLTNLYTSMSQKGDPRAERVLAKTLSLAGENYDALVGAAPPIQQQMPQMPPIPQQSNQMPIQV